jgi:N-acetylglucosaminyldiphosphoundecaprenol N-acetyl-beta-D-mannosaminyltransferase
MPQGNKTESSRRVGKRSMTHHQKVNLLGVNIDNISLDEVIAFIVNTIEIESKAIVSNVNVHALNIAYGQAWFREFLNESQLVFCDGFGVRMGAQITRQKLEYRFTPPDWVSNLCGIAAEKGYSVFFLGAKPGVAELAAEKLIDSHPGLEIYSHHGFFDKTGNENDKVIAKINDSKANILLVGMGMPLQEKWIKNNFDRLSNVNVFLPVGAMFDYVTDVVPRGPKWMTDHGLEWLARLIIEPKRLWKRYIIGNPLFLYRVFLQRLGLLKLPE